MKLAFFAGRNGAISDRPVLARATADGDGTLHLLVFGLLVPATIIALGLAGWYIVTGEAPGDIFDRLTGPPSLTMALPRNAPAIAPETTLMRPPSSDQSGVTVTMTPIPAAPTPPPQTPSVASSPAPAPAPAVAAAPPPPPPAPAKAAPVAATSPVAPVAPAVAPAMAPPSPAAPPTVAPAPMAPADKVMAGPPPPPIAEPATPPGGDTLAAPSFAQLPAFKDVTPLRPGPDPTLLQNTANGILPISMGDKSPRQAYARPFNAPAGQIRIAVVVTGLGLSREATDAAIAKLPGAIDLSFSPYATGLDTWVKKARAQGHEVLIDLPMEPPNFPANDSGPMAILSQDSMITATQRLDAILATTNSYVGVTGTLRSPVATSNNWGQILREIKQRGLIFVGDGLVGMDAANLPPSASVTLVADETPFRASIDSRLERIFAAAKRDGKAVAYVSARPVTFERLLAWSDTLPQKNAVLAPLSAVAAPAQ